jgi:enoyl-CoA hydratase/carnithine racemase
MYKTMAETINAAAVDPQQSVVVIQSNGDHFTAGNDISDFLNNPPLEDGSEVWQFIKAAHEFPKVLIAATQGNAVGIGSIVTSPMPRRPHDFECRSSTLDLSLSLAPAISFPRT